MTTSYDYVRQCEVTGERSALHLGLSGGGWRFQFRAHPQLGLMSVQDWKAFMARDPGAIFDEYNREVPPEEFFSFVEAKKKAPAQRDAELRPQDYPPNPDGRRWLDSEGYTFANYEFS